MPDSIPVPDGSVIVTPAQMFAELREMHDEIRQLRNVVDPAIRDLNTDILDHEQRIRVIEAKPDVTDDVEQRIRSLEANRWKLAGGIAIVSTLVGSGLALAVFELLAAK